MIIHIPTILLVVVNRKYKSELRITRSLRSISQILLYRMTQEESKEIGMILQKGSDPSCNVNLIGHNHENKGVMDMAL